MGRLRKKNLPKELKAIQKFIKKHHIFNIAVHANNELWTATCFYAFYPDLMALIFSTSTETKHGALMLINPEVVGTIALETKLIGKIQGIQFKGTVCQPNEKLLKVIKKIYYKRFPFTIGSDTSFWILYLNYIKFTNNKIGFSKKIIWERDNEIKISDK